MRELEKQLKALANRRRLEIIKIIRKSSACDVSTISDKLKLSFKSTSKHLAVLYGADMVEREQRGVQMFYRIASNPSPALTPILKLL
jgi:DNA-binding transcriptional ArsR family regulator